MINDVLPATICHYLHFVASAAMDERLSAYALIARAAINVTVPFLIRLFSERLSKLNQVPFHALRIPLWNILRC